MPGVLLFLPFLLVRFGLLAAKNRQALPRAAHFAPMQGREKIAYAVYQLATLGILLALLTRSWVLLALVLVFQGAAHWIILAEERWCQETFGESYRQYRGRVRRYL